MKRKQFLVATLVVLSLGGVCAASASADDSVQRASAASIGASLLTASVAGWVVYSGADLTVKAVQASANGVVLILEGASSAVETSARVSADAVQAASVGVGTSVKVVAESTGYALLASGVLLAFVPNEIGRALLHNARY